jgi:hypothetical protein
VAINNKDQGATTDHPQGLRRKVRTSCEKTPYLDRGDDDLKMTQMKGPSAKCQDEPRGGRRARTGPKTGWVDQTSRIGPSPFGLGHGPL